MQWQQASLWQNRDFEELSDQIFEKVGVRLSHTTLKRVWGKVSYSSFPSATTLNALVAFIGYKNWRTYRQQKLASHIAPEQVPIPAHPSVSAKKPNSKWWVLTGITIVLLCCISLLPIRQPSQLNFEALEFSFEKTTEDIPNTVVFHYEASNSNADSVFIQQSWNPALRHQVDKEGDTYTCTYYYPGYFRSKLVLNDQIALEKDLYIRSDGWLGTIDQQPLPHYFRQDRILKDSIVAIVPAFFEVNNIDILKDASSVRLTYVEDMGEVKSTNFELSTELRSTFGEGNAVCQITEVLILCSDGAFIIPLSVKGCVGELSLLVGEQELDGKNYDLSAFGVDFSNWVGLNVRVEEKAIAIYINGQKAYAGVFQEDIGKVVGFRYIFQAAGAIRKLELKSLDSSIRHQIL